MESFCGYKNCKNLPLYTCHCEENSILICEDHYDGHLLENGSHQIDVLFKILEDSEIRDYQEKIQNSEDYVIQIQEAIEAFFLEIRSLVDGKLKEFQDYTNLPTLINQRARNTVFMRRYILLQDCEFLNNLNYFDIFSLQEKYFAEINYVVSTYIEEILENSNFYHYQQNLEANEKNDDLPLEIPVDDKFVDENQEFDLEKTLEDLPINNEDIQKNPEIIDQIENQFEGEKLTKHQLNIEKNSESIESHDILKPNEKKFEIILEESELKETELGKNQEKITDKHFEIEKKNESEGIIEKIDNKPFEKFLEIEAPSELFFPWTIGSLIDAKKYVCSYCSAVHSNARFFSVPSNLSKTIEVKFLKGSEISDLVFMSACKCILCKECLETHLKIMSKSQSNYPLRCPKCSTVIPITQLQYVSPQSSLKKILFFAAGSGPGSFTNLFPRIECPKCRSLIWTHVNQIKVICNNTLCGFTFCKKCLDEFHEGFCKYRGKIENFKTLEKFSNISIVTQCPACGTPYGTFKSNFSKAIFLRCCSKFCQKEFCFNCSAFAGPILKHGNHYHRPECAFFEVQKKNDRKKNSCEFCVASGRLCDRPLRLKNIRRSFCYD